MRLFGILLLLASAAPAAEDARQIVMRSVNADNENALLISKYIYEEKENTREFDGSGGVKTTKSERREVLFIGGKQYKQLLEKDGKPLPADQARKEQARIDKASADAAKLSEIERKQHLDDYNRQQAKDRERIKAIPDAYNFTLLGSATVGGRDVYVIQAEPKKDYHGKYQNLLRSTQGKLYVDKNDYEWVRIEVDVLDDLSFGLGLAKVAKGARFTFQQKRLNQEVWLPETLTLKASARALWKHVNIETAVTYGNYRKFQSDARVLDTSEIK